MKSSLLSLLLTLISLWHVGTCVTFGPGQIALLNMTSPHLIGLERSTGTWNGHRFNSPRENTNIFFFLVLTLLCHQYHKSYSTLHHWFLHMSLILSDQPATNMAEIRINPSWDGSKYYFVYWAAKHFNLFHSLQFTISFIRYLLFSSLLAFWRDICYYVWAENLEPKLRRT